MITLHCPKTLNSMLFVLLGCVSLCSPSLYYYYERVKKMKRVVKKCPEIKKEYRDCIKRKWRQVHVCAAINK